MSKNVTPYLRVGDKVSALVREILSDGNLIASFQGDLLNVQNRTHKEFKVGEEVILQVMRLKPLSFKMVAERGPSPLKESSWRV